MPDKPHLLVNLPAGFFASADLRPVFARLARWARVRKRSHDTADTFAKDLAWADACIKWSWPAWTDALLDGAPRLRFSGQLDITQAAARVALDRGLRVSVSRGAWAPAVAEMALALVLSTLRKTSDYHARMRHGRERWVRDFPTDIDPEERQLSGRPVGIIGLGAVGRRLAELLRPFDCPLSVCDPFVPQGAVERVGGIMASVVRIVDWLADDLEAHLTGRPLRHRLTESMIPGLDR